MDERFQHTRAIELEEIHKIIDGKTEKPLGINPVKLLSNGPRDGRHFRIGRIPIDLICDNECGDKFDGTVGDKIVDLYLSRDRNNMPPIIALQGRGEFKGKLNLLDGGHRVTVARKLKEKDIFAIIEIDNTLVDSQLTNQNQNSRRRPSP